MEPDILNSSTATFHNLSGRFTHVGVYGFFYRSVGKAHPHYQVEHWALFCLCLKFQERDAC